ncbi:hypothetical protein [Lautropia mirabilis]
MRDLNQDELQTISGGDYSDVAGAAISAAGTEYDGIGYYFDLSRPSIGGRILETNDAVGNAFFE